MNGGAATSSHEREVSAVKSGTTAKARARAEEIRSQRFRLILLTVCVTAGVIWVVGRLVRRVHPPVVRLAHGGKCGRGVPVAGRGGLGRVLRQ